MTKSPAAIVAKVASRHCVDVSDILGPSRESTVVRARQDAMLELRDQLGISHTAIGALLGRDHSTVGHGIKLAAERRKMRPPPTNVRHLTPDEIEIVRKMQAEGFGVDPIARRLQCSKYVLKREFKAATGCEMKPSKRHNQPARDPVTDHDIGAVPKGHPLYEADQEMARARRKPRHAYEGYPRQSSLADF